MKNFNKEMMTNVDVVECNIKGYKRPIHWNEYNVLVGTKLYRVAPLQNFITKEEYKAYCEDPCLILDASIITADILYATRFSTFKKSKSIDYDFIFINREKGTSEELLNIIKDELIGLIDDTMVNVKDKFLEDVDVLKGETKFISPVSDRFMVSTEYPYTKSDEVYDTDTHYSHTLEMVTAINIKDENDPKKVTYDCYTINVKSGKEENQYKVQPYHMHKNPKEKFPSWVTVLYWNSLESDTCYEIRFIMNPNQTNILKKPKFITELKNIADKLVATSNCTLALSGKPIKTSVYVNQNMMEVVYEEDKGE